VPAWCTFDVRAAIYPGQGIAEAKREIEQAVLAAARQNRFMDNYPPKIVYHGFEAEGYVLKDAEEPVAKLGAAHRAVFCRALEELAVAGTTDARFCGLYAGIPALVCGPNSEAIHGFDERVDLESMRRITQAMTLFIADWCGLVKR
jgi:acetylornithine deacetylase